MPLHIDSVSTRASAGALLRWLLDTDEVRKQQVGSIALSQNHATIEIPDSAGPRLARRLDGGKFMGRVVQVWFEAPLEETDHTGHFAQLNRWLDLEQTAEARQASEWQSTSGEDDSSTGFTNLAIRSEDTTLGGYTLLTLGRGNPMQSLPATRISVGTPVRLGEQGQSEGHTWRGVVTRMEKGELDVALRRSPDAESEKPLFRMDAADDETATLRSRAALARARHATGDRLSEIRDVCLGRRAPSFSEQPNLEFVDPYLNDSQREAIAFARSADDLAIIHGPPGTGKTRTLVELIRQAVSQKQKVIVCAPSNLGVDNLFERLSERGVKAVRIGHVARVLPTLREQCLDALVAKHPDVRRVKKLRLEAADLFRQSAKSSRSLDREARKALREEARDVLDDAREMEGDIAQKILDQADVVCATNTGIHPDLLGARRFDLAIIDEACQCSEPSCWIPLLRADRLVLAGDHCQLPPTVISQEAADEGFSISMQERLVKLYGETVCRTLKIQYRMHEAIMRFSATQFYDGKLEPDPAVAERLLRDLPGVIEDELTINPVRFIDTSGSSFDDAREPAGRSVFNPQEADLAIKKSADLIALGVKPEDIAIITPYTAQVRALQDRATHEAVEIGSIDGFQGREKEAVIISLVRSNTDNEIGFLQDTRRMNVALTRARRKLIVIGDSSTIAANSFYQALLDHFDAVNAYHGVWDE